jgi:predicted dehydrogenase
VTVVSTVEELPAIDAAVIATSTSAHFSAMQQLLPRSIPMFVEKPLVSSLQQAEILQPYADLLFTMDKWRYHPGILELARLAQSGVVGEIQSISCTRWGWRSHPLDVSAIWHLAPHDLAIILEILGFLPEPRFARAEYHDNLLSGGVVLLGELPWGELRFSERRERHCREVRVHGTEAFAVLSDSYSPSIELFRMSATASEKPPAAEVLPLSEDMPLLAELAAFLRYLNGGPTPKSNFADSLIIIKVLEKIHGLVQPSQ